MMRVPFHANDHPTDYGCGQGGSSEKKECGWLIMISGFICQKYGSLALPEMVAENALLPDGE